MKKISFLILFILITGIFSCKEVYAIDVDITSYDDFDYTQIQDIIDNVSLSNKNMDFKSYVNGLVTGEEPFSFKNIFTDLKDSVKNEISGNLNMIIKLIGIAIVAAIFTNFSNIFQNNQVAETGFYIAYLLLFTLLASTFLVASNIASTVLSAVLHFMQALIPTYLLSIAFCAGSSTSLVFYESTILIITIVDAVLIKIIIPMINIYMVIVLANNLSKEDLLSKLADLLSFLVKGALKSLLAMVVGVNTIQGLILPVADSVKSSLLLKTSSAIPGIGNSLESVTKTVLGAGVLVKNAIGVAGLMVIVIICVVPIIKLGIITIIYKIGTAVVQPISDKRIISCIDSTAEASKLLLNTVLTGAILFILTIAIIVATTNVKLFQ